MNIIPPRLSLLPSPPSPLSSPLLARSSPSSLPNSPYWKHTLIAGMSRVEGFSSDFFSCFSIPTDSTILVSAPGGLFCKECELFERERGGGRERRRGVRREEGEKEEKKEVAGWGVPLDTTPCIAPLFPKVYPTTPKLLWWPKHPILYC